MTARALIAEDEPLLAANLKAELLELWPELTVIASVGDGAKAHEVALDQQPDILFLDIRMPGMTGLECAEALAEDWPEEGKRFPLVVFVTAYDQYAVDAFERAAFDYVVKPVQRARLGRTCIRLKERLAESAKPEAAQMSLDTAMDQIRQLCNPKTAAVQPARARTPLRVIQASVGNRIAMVPVDEVLYFEAADKYVRVVTAEHEHLIRTSLRDLLPQLDTDRFWQVHRGAVVRCDVIESAERDGNGKLTLALKGHTARLTVSRLYSGIFRAM
jgi:DNA-binding LytR/AlgR family response regulator